MRTEVKQFQLLALAAAVKLEGFGLKHSSGRSATKKAQDVTGLRTRDRAKLVEKLKEMAYEA